MTDAATFGKHRRHEFLGSGIRIVADVGGDPGRPTVILAHGGGQTRHSWSGAMDALVAAGYHVINYDTRGHSDSGWSPDGAYSMRDRAEDLRSILDEVTGGPVAFVGASMGGNTSLYVAATTEDLPLAALVLVDIVPDPDPKGIKHIREFMERNIGGFDSLEAVVDAVAAYNPSRPRPSNPSGLRKNLREVDGRFYWHWDPKVLSIQRPIEASILDAALADPRRPLDFPILLVRGLQSDVVSDDGVAQLLR